MKRQGAKSTTKVRRSFTRSGARQIEGNAAESDHSGECTTQANGSQNSGDHPWVRIAQRAYSLYEEEGYRHGNDVEHWLKAEREVTSQEV